MKLQKNNRPLYRNPLVWLIALLLVLALVLFILEKTRVTNFIQTPGSKEVTPQQAADQKKADDARKQDFIEKSPEPTPTPLPQDSDAITLSAAQEGSSVNILTKLKGFSSGSCELLASNGTKTHTATADIIYQPEFSSCAGFSIPVAQLGAGSWSIVLNATPTGGSVITKTTSVEVK